MSFFCLSSNKDKKSCNLAVQGKIPNGTTLGIIIITTTIIIKGTVGKNFNFTLTISFNFSTITNEKLAQCLAADHTGPEWWRQQSHPY
jgi:hypothetical protein